MKTTDILNTELITKDTTFVGVVARRLIQQSIKALYVDGKRPTPKNLQLYTDRTANALLVNILKAIDYEIISRNVTHIHLT